MDIREDLAQADRIAREARRSRPSTDPIVVPCPDCGFEFLVSPKVMRRILACPNRKCLSVWHFQKGDKRQYLLTFRGRFSSVAEQAATNRNYAFERRADILADLNPSVRKLKLRRSESGVLVPESGSGR